MGYVENIRSLVGHTPLIFVRPTVLIVNEMGQFLLVQNLNGRWSVPGGLMEIGESTEETARREIKEELGLTVGTLHLLGVFSGKEFFTRLKNGDEYYSVNIGYITNEFAGKIVLDKTELADAKFYNPAELPENMIPMLKQQLPRLANMDIYIKLTSR